MEQAGNGGKGQQKAGALELGCGDRVRFQWPCVAWGTAEKRSRKCPGGHALTSEAPGLLEPSRRRRHVRAGRQPGRATTAGALGEQAGPHRGEAEEEPGAGAKPTLSREGPFPGARGSLGGSCCCLGSRCRRLNREQDGSKPFFPLLPTMELQLLWESIVPSPPAQLCF